MDKPDEKKSAIDETVETLFDFAIDRSDLKMIMSALPDQITIKSNILDYELQLLKIIAVGWSISYYLEAGPLKNEMATKFWLSVQQFSQNISHTTEMMVGSEIDYFQTIKDRLDAYVEAMNNHPKAPEPAVVIGPEFAKTCGNQDDIYAVMAGSRMFIAVIGSVKTYLEALTLR